jgi:H+/gluconate symporter-like permease
MGLVGILVALGLLIWLAYRGWSILLLAPAAAVLVAGLAGEPLLAHWTQTFMGSAARFIMQFFPIFLLGALFGKLMEDRPLRGNLLRGSNYAEVVVRRQEADMTIWPT